MTKPKRGKSTVDASPSAMPHTIDTLESLKEYMKNEFSQISENLSNVTENMATKECITRLMSIIDEQKEKIQKMEDKIAVMDSHIIHLRKSNEANEQYQRRLCLRINGIDMPSNGLKETGEECLSKVRNALDKLKVDIPDTVIDRAHRIGRMKVIDGKKVQPMIVRFTTWRHRTNVYRARKNCEEYRIKLDLTKDRVSLLKRANELLISDQNSFAFCNYNCQPVWFNNGKYRHFGDIDELKRLIEKG